MRPLPNSRASCCQLIEPLWQYEPSWRVLPTDPVPVVLTLNGQRTGRMMRWDLVPFRSHGVRTGKVLINAKAENLETNYYWKAPWERGQRCIFSMAGFYEPHKFEEGRKEPFYVHLSDLREQDHEAWLSGSISDAKAALAPYPSELMVAWQVSRRVNSPKAPNDAGLIEPIASMK